MEKKKRNLSTVLLVIAVIVIIFMGIYIYMQKIEADKQIAELENNESEMQETINDLQGKIDSISDTINDKNEINLNKNNLIQFKTEFYDLKEIAQEYRDYQNIKNYKDFNYDLDGDGIIDKITISHKTEKDDIIGEINSYPIKLNGEIFSEGSAMDSIYIVDLNENDKNIEVVIYDDGPSDDPNYTIYSKNGNKMIELNNIGGYPLKTDKQGTILVENVYERAISPEIYFEYYVIQDGKIEVKNIDIEKIKNIEFKTSYLYFSEDYKNVNKIFGELAPDVNSVEENLKILDIEQLNENITFKIKEFVVEENNGYDGGYGYKIYVELSDGREGYVFHIQLAG